MGGGVLIAFVVGPRVVDPPRRRDWAPLPGVFRDRRSGWDVPGRAWKAFAEGTHGGGNTHKEAEDRGSADPRP